MTLTIRLLVRTFKQHKYIMPAYLSSAALLTCAGLISLWITKNVSNLLLQLLDHGTSLQTSALKGLIFFLAVQVFMEVSQSYLSQISSQVLVKRLNASVSINATEMILGRLWSHPPDEFEDSEKYMEFTAIQQGVQQYISQLVPSTFSLVKGGIGVVVYSSVLMYLSPLSLTLILVLSLSGVVTNVMFSKQDMNLMKQVAPEMRYTYRLTSIMTSQSTIRDIHLYGFGEHLFRTWKTLYNRLTFKEIALSKKQVQISTIVQFADYSLTAVCTVVVLLNARSYSLSLGAVLAFIQAVTFIQQNLSQLLVSGTQFYTAHLSMTRIDKLGTTGLICASLDVARKLSDVPNISLDGVYYSYPTRQEYALQNINLEITPGETVAIVGPNGSGKSTLVKCIMGMYSPQSGYVHCGKLTNAKFSSEYRFGAVFQDYVIYPLTVAENIQICNLKDVKDTVQINDLLHDMGLSDVVNKLPNGLETVMDTSILGGGTMSQGQLQRIAICRALYTEPSVLFLDEPTASLDPIAEQQIYRSVLGRMSGKTTIFISHRLNICPNVDKVVVMDNGLIVDVGTHEELMRRCSLYFNLNQQFSVGLTV
jgi:ATP-binding cassette subfamily B protein